MTGYFSAIWRLRYFWMALVRIDLRNRYRRSVIGIGWSLLHPIAMTVVLCVVFSRLFEPGHPHVRAVSAERADAVGFHHGGGDAGLPVFLPGRIVHPPAPRAAGDLSAADHLGRRLSLSAGVRHRAGVRLVRERVWKPAGAAEPRAHVCVVVRDRLVAGGLHGRGQRDVPGLAALDRSPDADSVLRHADHLPAGDAAGAAV